MKIKGVAVLYNNAWRSVVYVNLNKIDNETVVLRQCVCHVDALCQMTVIRNWTGCARFGSDARERLNQLTKTEGLLKEIIGQETGGKGGGITTSSNFPSHPTYPCEQELSTPVRLNCVHKYLMTV